MADEDEALRVERVASVGVGREGGEEGLEVRGVGGVLDGVGGSGEAVVRDGDGAARPGCEALCERGVVGLVLAAQRQ